MPRGGAAVKVAESRPPQLLEDQTAATTNGSTMHRPPIDRARPARRGGQPADTRAAVIQRKKARGWQGDRAVTAHLLRSDSCRVRPDYGEGGAAAPTEARPEHPCSARRSPASTAR
jgi:hypothetical protein